LGANTLFDYTGDIRKAIYTTNAIESLNITLRKVLAEYKDHDRLDAKSVLGQVGEISALFIDFQQYFIPAKYSSMMNLPKLKTTEW
jgi:hypothetical protein